MSAGASTGNFCVGGTLACLTCPFRYYRRHQGSQSLKCEVTVENVVYVGKVNQNRENPKEYYVSFLGLPYAEPPVGNYRFQFAIHFGNDDVEPKFQPTVHAIRLSAIEEDGTAARRRFAFEFTAGTLYDSQNLTETPIQSEKPPLPRRVRLRKTVVRAYNSGSCCIQRRDDFDPKNPESKYIGSEDCLYLNVYCPKRPREITEFLPVLVYFHGGAYMHGAGSYVNYTPDSIIRHNVIFVTVNYRLGPLGFLNMRTSNCRGNAGLKDQVKSLEWVRDHIHKFKGDSHNVTIAGNSAGATCVNFHLISPMSKGLFHKAIVQSGGLYCPWGHKGHSRELQQLFAEKHNLEGEIRQVVVDKFKQIPPKDFLEQTRNILLDRLSLNPTQLTCYLGPSIEADPVGAFIPDTVENLLKNSEPVPILAGITRTEGYMTYCVNPEDANYTVLVRDDNYFIQFLTGNLHWTEETAKRNMDKLRNYYFPELEAMNNKEIEERLMNLITDIFFRRFYDCFKFGKEKYNIPFYVYEFNYFGSNLDIYKPASEIRTISASGHGAEVPFLFCPKELRDKHSPFTEEVEHVIGNMCSMWANFCRTGIPKSDLEPEIKWKPHTKDDPCYLRITEKLGMQAGYLHEDRWKFLNSVVQPEPIIESLQVSPCTPTAPEIPPYPNPQEPQPSTSRAQSELPSFAPSVTSLTIHIQFPQP